MAFVKYNLVPVPREYEAKLPINTRNNFQEEWEDLLISMFPAPSIYGVYKDYCKMVVRPTHRNLVLL